MEKIRAPLFRAMGRGGGGGEGDGRKEVWWRRRLVARGTG
jgi:hypothetical protein